MLSQRPVTKPEQLKVVSWTKVMTTVDAFAPFLSLTRRFQADSPRARLWESNCILALSLDGSSTCGPFEIWQRNIQYSYMWIPSCLDVGAGAGQVAILHTACMDTYKQDMDALYPLLHHPPLRKCKSNFLLHRHPCLIQITEIPTSPRLFNSSYPSLGLFCFRQ